MKRGIPDRGDILHVDPDPAKGREQRGKRFVLVLSPAAFNRFGLALVCPVTQVRTLDYKERNAKWVEAFEEQIVEDVLARVRTLLD